MNKKRKPQKSIINFMEKTLSGTKISINALGRAWQITFKKGKPYLNYFNIFYALPKRISLYIMLFGFVVFLIIGTPLAVDFLFFSEADPMLTKDVRIGLAWGCVTALIIIQLSVVGYAYLSKESLAKAKVEIENKVMWYRWAAFISIVINILFSIIVLLYAGYSPRNTILTWTGISFSIGLGIITIILYRIQRRIMQRKAFEMLQNNTADHLPENPIEATREINFNNLLNKNANEVLKDKSSREQLELLIKKREKAALDEIAFDVEIGWLEKTRIWNWSIMKRFTNYLEEKDFITKYYDWRKQNKFTKNLKWEEKNTLSKLTKKQKYHDINKNNSINIDDILPKVEEYQDKSLNKKD